MRSRRFAIALATLTATLIIGGVISAIWPTSPRVRVFRSRSVSVDGIERRYHLAVPIEQDRPLPVVFAFHGVGQAAEAMIRETGWDHLAGTRRFLLVAPQCSEPLWWVTDRADEADNLDNLRLFDVLLEKLSADHEIDRERIFLIGMSDGGRFVHRLAAERSDVIAAIISHSATRPKDLPPPVESVPVLFVVGGEDPVAPFVASDVEAARKSGQIVELITVSGLGHDWACDQNEAMWAFLAQHTRP